MSHYNNLNIVTNCLDDTPLGKNASAINLFQKAVISHMNNGERERKSLLPRLLSA